MSELLDSWYAGLGTPAVAASWQDRLHQVRRRKRAQTTELSQQEPVEPPQDQTGEMMEDQELLVALRNQLGHSAVREFEPLALHTSLRVGGPADILAIADDAAALQAAVTLAWQHDVPCRVLGAGSNVLVSDRGIGGLVVLNRAKAITFSEQSVRAESGASFSTLAQRCVTRGFAGLEWATGIPGTVGGAVVGNAGAWGGDVASALASAQVMLGDGSVNTWSVDRLEYGYRTSILKRSTGSGGTGVPATARRPVVLEASFKMQLGDRRALRARVVEIAARRRASQPGGATCGSVFRNPPGDHAGRLIEAAGLKSEHRGNAIISPVHGNFIVNLGDASASDVMGLIQLARQSIKERFGVLLELEIELVGRW